MSGATIQIRDKKRSKQWSNEPIHHKIGCKSSFFLKELARIDRVYCHSNQAPSMLASQCNRFALNIRTNLTRSHGRGKDQACKTIYCSVTTADFNWFGIFCFYSLKLLWLTLSQWYTNVEVEFMPIYKPSDEEKNNPKLFARNVRNVMAKWVSIFRTKNIKFSLQMRLFPSFVQSTWCADIRSHLWRQQTNDTSISIKFTTSWKCFCYIEIEKWTWVNKAGKIDKQFLIFAERFSSLIFIFSLTQTNIEDNIVENYLIHSANCIVSLSEFALRLQIPIDDTRTLELFNIFDVVSIQFKCAKCFG